MANNTTNPQNSTEKLWLHRQVNNISKKEIHESIKDLAGDIIIPKISKLTISLVYDEDVKRAISGSPFRGMMNTTDVAYRLEEELGKDHSQPIVVHPRTIKQYGRFIGLYVESPELEQETEQIHEYLRYMLGIRNRMRQPSHISVAQGWLREVYNVDEIVSQLPQNINLNKLRFKST